MEIIRTNIKESMEEDILLDSGILVDAWFLLNEFFEHFNVQEKVDKLSLRQAQQLVPTAIRWWRVYNAMIQEIGEDYQLLRWEDEYYIERLGIHRRIKKAGLHFK